MGIESMLALGKLKTVNLNILHLVYLSSINIYWVLIWCQVWCLVLCMDDHYSSVSPVDWVWVVIQSLRHVQLFVAPWTAACQAVLHHLLEFSQLMSIEWRSTSTLKMKTGLVGGGASVSDFAWDQVSSLLANSQNRALNQHAAMLSRKRPASYKEGGKLATVSPPSWLYVWKHFSSNPATPQGCCKNQNKKRKTTLLLYHTQNNYYYC